VELPSEDADVPSRLARWREDAERIDVALYAAIAQTPTPALDRLLAQVSHAADYSRPWVASAAILAAVGGERGRSAATSGLASVAVAAALVNLGVKPLGRRRRPDRVVERVPVARHTRMPASTSFPSGHSATAFAFATGVGHVLPSTAIPLRGLAAVVAYSRVHTGVHYPGDVVAGALIGTMLAQLTVRALERRATRLHRNAHRAGI
jgi:membrane-associated phospholipid phosphatase